MKKPDQRRVVDRRTMMKGLTVGVVGAATASAGMLGCQAKKKQVPVDLDDPAQCTEAFMKMRGDLAEKEVAFSFSGDIHSFVEGERSKKMFRFDAIGTSRLIRMEDGGWQMVHREFGAYRDPETDEILERWTNPWTEKEVEVIPVANDPVNWTLKQPRPFPYTEITGDVCFNLDVYLRYPNPLNRKDYAEYSQSDFYEAAELFQFFTKLEDLEDPDVTSAGCVLSWARISPWAPWMEMGDRPGKMVYHARGKKLTGGIAEIPASLHEYVSAKYPKFLTAPEAYEEPNETSFTYFKKIIDARRAEKP